MDPDRALATFAALTDPVRRALYRFVVGRRKAVGRSEAAAGTGVSRSLAAYHLDRLADDGLLDVEYRRLGDKAGPGAGRPAKLYRRADGDVEVSIPPRNYRLAAEILLDSVAGDTGPLSGAARRHGRTDGEDLAADLESAGFEPVEDDGSIRLANCPFVALRDRDRDTVCRMNLAYAEGLLEGAGRDDLRAVLRPEQDWCCVVFEPAAG